MQFTEESKIYKVHIPRNDIVEYSVSNSMLGDHNLMYELALIADMLDGCAAEAGAGSCGVIYLLANVMKQKTIYGFDSWEGVPEATVEDFVDNKDPLGKGWGKHALPTEQMQKELAAFGNRVRLIKGWFVDTLSTVCDESFCFIHLDTDRYESTLQCLEFFWPRMVQGGLMLFDDYGFYRTPGVTIAVDNFFADKEYDVFWRGGKPIIKAL